MAFARNSFILLSNLTIMHKDGVDGRSRQPFRFQDMWLSHTGFREIVDMLGPVRIGMRQLQVRRWQWDSNIGIGPILETFMRRKIS